MPSPILTVQDLCTLTEVAVKFGLGKYADHFLNAAYDKADGIPVHIELISIQKLCQVALTENAKAILSPHQRELIDDLNPDL